MPSPTLVSFKATNGFIEAELVGITGDHIAEIIKSTNSFYEKDLLDLLGSLPIEEDHLLVDVGANLGNHTVFMGLTFPNPILAIEPHPINHFLLTENVQHNGLGERVSRFEGCAWDSMGVIHLDQQHQGNLGSFHAEQSRTLDGIPAAPLDDLVEGRPVGLIKIDVEGGELRVLSGAQRTLERFHPVLFVEAHGPSARREILAFLGPFGYLPIQVAGLSETYLFTHPQSPLLMPMAGIREFASLLHQRHAGL